MPSAPHNISTVAWLALAVAVGGRARAEDTRPVGDALPMRIVIGESIALCSTGTLTCPAGAVICDDLSVVSVAADERGPLLMGVKLGKTLCSAASASGAGFRRLYQVTVVPKPEPEDERRGEGG